MQANRKMAQMEQERNINSYKDPSFTYKQKKNGKWNKRGTSILENMPYSTYNLEENGKWKEEKINVNSCKMPFFTYDQGSYKPKA